MRILEKPIDLGPDARRADAPAEAGGLSAVLAKAPAPLLLAVSGLIVGLVGWDATLHPLPVLLAVTGWGLYLLRASLAGFARAMAPSRSAPAVVKRPVAVAVNALDEAAPARTVIMAGLSLDGRLHAASEVEVFGRVSGEVVCDVIRVHPGAELRASVACRRIGIAEDAVFEGSASRPG